MTILKNKWIPIAMTLALACAPATLLAAQQHDGAWCADAALFLEQSLGPNATQKALNHKIDTQYVSIKQKFPNLSKKDAHHLVNTAYKHKRNAFGAAKAVVQNCGKQKKPASHKAAYLAKTHSSKWCAEALDFAIGTAGYRAMGQTQAMSQHSIKGTAPYYAQMYPALKEQDLLDIVHSVFTNKWSRFDAAQAVTSECKVG